MTAMAILMTLGYHTIYIRGRCMRPANLLYAASALIVYLYKVIWLSKTFITYIIFHISLYFSTDPV
jgi:hypothetical protein